MGAIQSSINQMLSTAGIAGRLSPEYETKQELYKLGKEEQLLDKQINASELHGAQVHDPDALKNLGNLKERQIQIAQERFQLDPTKEGFQNIISKQQSYKKFNKIANILIQRQDQALKNVDSIQEAKKQQKRNFMAYLSKQPIAGGGTVGELPIKVQKQIASQYSKTQRKQLMDTMDAQKEKNK